MEPLSPRANGLEDIKCRELAAADLGEATSSTCSIRTSSSSGKLRDLTTRWPALPITRSTSCPHMIEVLDKRLDGLTIEELAAERASRYLALHEQDGATADDRPDQQQHGQGRADQPPDETQRDDHRRDGEQHHAGVLLDDREGALRPDPVDFLCHAIRMPAVALVWFP
jgi:hypothetical protein